MTPADLSVAEAARKLAAGETTSLEITEAVLRRAAQTEAELHCYLTIDQQGALASAEESDRRRRKGAVSALSGIPIALKDNMCTDGIETTCSSQILAGYRPPYDATVVRRLRAAGAVIVGKTNLDEFAMGSSTENSAYGPTHNPWDPGRVPGGSSGGSAAAVSAGSALAALGSDTGGSIRQPASLCGVVGFKPTYGRVSRYGLVAFASSLDQIGPITRTVEDAALIFSVIGGHDQKDATSYTGEMPELSALGSGVAGLRIGVVQEASGAGFEPDVETACRQMAERLTAAGASLEEISVPTFTVALSAYYLIAPAEASANLARFDGVRYGLREEGTHVEEMMARTRAAGFGPEVSRRILLGTYALSAGYYDAFYGQAQRVRTLLINELKAAFERVDVLILPTSPTTAFEMGAKTQDPLSMYLTDVCTIPANLAGTPAISVPIGLDRSGLPIGIQVMGRALGESVMLAVAAEIERLARFTARPPMLEAWS